MQNKVFWFVLAATVAVLIGVTAMLNSNSTSDTASSNDSAITAEDHVVGPETAKVTLVEYGDLQCPACASIEPHVNKLATEYEGTVRIVFRHFPLSSIHPNAFSSARATEAAAAQGKFWEMQDLLYERQTDWSTDTSVINKLKEYASELKLDVDKFNSDYSSQASTDRINRDVTIGRNLKVDSTPTFFLNDVKIETPRTYEAFVKLIEDALKS